MGTSCTMCNTVVPPGQSPSAMEGESASAVEVRDLNFQYPAKYAGSPMVLKNVSCSIPAGARCLLIGANGAGKSTLLSLLAGKHIHPLGSVMVLDQPAFHNTHPDIQSITGNWTHTLAYGAHSVPYAKDISVQELLDTQPTPCDPSRLAKLIEVLDVNLQWRMHRVSDGQRRRVQLLVGLVKPFRVLLLDEVTVDLDVLVRANLLRYLQDECESRGATIVYATHIFDGLDRWATHIARISKGELTKYGPVSEFVELQELLVARVPSPLLKVVTSWLRAEKDAQPGKKATPEPVDLKLSEYIPGVPFAHNRMYNRTC